MDTGFGSAELELAIVIVDFGLGSKVLKLAAKHGIRHGIVFLGAGTLNNRMLEFLRLADIRKEIVLMASDKDTIDAAMEAVYERFRLDKPFHGIAFVKPLSSIIGLGTIQLRHYNQQEGEEVMHRSLMIIVDRGKADRVMEIATKAGARGGTVMKARSAAEVYDGGSLFGIDIEPEREVVLILAEAAVSEVVAEAVRSAFDGGADGNGMILCQDVRKVYGVK